MGGNGETSRKSCRPILADTSSLILLYKAGILGLVCDNYRLRLAAAVYAELNVSGKAGVGMFALLTDKGDIEVLSDAPFQAASESSGERTLEGMGCGERVTLLHLQAGHGVFVILDDKKPLKYCENNSIPFINALLVPRVLHFSGSLSLVQKLWYEERLRCLGYYSEDIRRRAELLSEECLQVFFP